MRKNVDKKKNVIGYICGTDPTDLHIGALDVKIYPTVKDLKKARKCWKECGIKEVLLGDTKIKGTSKYV